MVNLNNCKNQCVWCTNKTKGAKKGAGNFCILLFPANKIQGKYKTYVSVIG